MTLPPLENKLTLEIMPTATENRDSKNRDRLID